MRKEVTKEELYYFARIQGVDAEPLMGIRRFIDYKKVRDTLIFHEFQERDKQHQGTKKQIIDDLVKKYKVSKGSVEVIIYGKVKNKGKLCVKCGTRITSFRWNKNGGICNDCISKEQLNNETNEQAEDSTRDEASTRE